MNVPFHVTSMGRSFFQGRVPQVSNALGQIATALTRIADALEAANEKSNEEIADKDKELEEARNLAERYLTEKGAIKSRLQAWISHFETVRDDSRDSRLMAPDVVELLKGIKSEINHRGGI